MAAHLGTDVVVVGAGAAGLAATRALRKKGLRVALLEARDRVGGRIETLRDRAWPCPIELGAEFVHGHPHVLERWFKRGGMEVQRHPDGHWGLFDKRLRSVDDSFAEVSKLLIESGKADTSFERFLVDPRTKKRWPKVVRQMAAMFVEGYYAAPLRVAGTRALREMEQATSEIEAQKLYRMMGGYDALPLYMARRLSRGGADGLWLNARVERIEWGGRGVQVHSLTQGGAPLPIFKARAAIVTLPVPLLAARPNELGAIRFSPGLPKKAQAAKRLANGAIVKIALRFREIFWTRKQVRGHTDGELPRFSFVHAPGHPFPTFWTPKPFDVPVLIGWSGGDVAERLSGLDELELLGRALETLSQAFGVPAARLETSLEALHVRNWQTDPFARGGYCVVPPAALDAQQALAEPVSGRLFFAGEATHTEGFSGTVQGALETGERAAREVLEAMR